MTTLACGELSTGRASPDGRSRSRATAAYGFPVSRLYRLLLGTLLLWLPPAAARADNAIVTIDSTHGYGTPFPLWPGTTTAMGKIGPTTVVENDNAQIGRALGRLREGDVLVINTHSSAHVFGMGDKGTHPWSEFYQTFGVKKPAWLSMVIIHGCVYDSVRGEETAATDAEIQSIRKALNAASILSFNHTVDPRAGRLALYGIIDGMAGGKKITDLIHDPTTLRFLYGPGIEYTETLQEIEKQLRGTGLEGIWDGGGVAVKFQNSDGVYLGHLLALPKGHKGVEKRGTLIFSGSEGGSHRYTGDWYWFMGPEASNAAKHPAKRDCTLRIEGGLLHEETTAPHYTLHQSPFSSEGTWNDDAKSRQKERKVTDRWFRSDGRDRPAK